MAFYWKYGIHKVSKSCTLPDVTDNCHLPNKKKLSTLDSSKKSEYLELSRNTVSEVLAQQEVAPKNKITATLLGTAAGTAAGTALLGYGLYKLFEPTPEFNETPKPMDVNAERGRLDKNGVPANNVKIDLMGLFSSNQPFPINSGVHLKTYQTNTEGFDQNYGKIAVIVEPRPLEILVKVIRHAMDALSVDWKFQVFHGSNNKLFLEKHFYNEIASGKLILTDMHCKNLSVKIYNNLMLDLEFWNHVLGETVLMFEIDSTVCGTDSSIEPFLGYDYVGAPWGNPEWYYQSVYEKGGKRFLFMKWYASKNNKKLSQSGYKFVKNIKVRVGNSGFSLRKRSKMLATLNNYRPGNLLMVNRAYDFYLAGAFLNAGYSVPDVNTASGFSVEGIIGDQPPFGTHKPWEYLSTEQIDNLGAMCKNLETLRFYYANEKKIQWGIDASSSIQLW